MNLYVICTRKAYKQYFDDLKKCLRKYGIAYKSRYDDIYKKLYEDRNVVLIREVPHDGDIVVDLEDKPRYDGKRAIEVWRHTKMGEDVCVPYPIDCVELLPVNKYNIDVLFYGVMSSSKRRQEIISRLSNICSPMKFEYGEFYGKELSEKIISAKIILLVYRKNVPYLDSTRVLPLICQGKVFLGERPADDDYVYNILIKIYPKITNFFVDRSDVTEMKKRCLKICRNFNRYRLKILKVRKLLMKRFTINSMFGGTVLSEHLCDIGNKITL